VSEHHTLMYIPISMVPAMQSIMPRPNGEPATHVVVPREPTDAMADAATISGGTFTGAIPLWLHFWRAMLAASEPRHD